jgi:hypothetical protein
MRVRVSSESVLCGLGPLAGEPVAPAANLKAAWSVATARGQLSGGWAKVLGKSGAPAIAGGAGVTTDSDAGRPGSPGTQRSTARDSVVRHRQRTTTVDRLVLAACGRSTVRLAQRRGNSEAAPGCPLSVRSVEGVRPAAESESESAFDLLFIMNASLHNDDIRFIQGKS